MGDAQDILGIDGKGTPKTVSVYSLLVGYNLFGENGTTPPLPMHLATLPVHHSINQFRNICLIGDWNIVLEISRRHSYQ